MSNLIPFTDTSFLKGWKTHLIAWSPIISAKLAGLAVFLGIDISEGTIANAINEFIGVAENAEYAFAALISWARGLPPQIRALLDK